jgi:hypothetical protein
VARSPGEMGRGEGHHLAARRSFSAAMRGDELRELIGES